MAFGVDLRVKQVFARKAVWLEKMDALRGKRPENRLKDFRRDCVLVERHIAVGSEDVLMMQGANGVQYRCYGFFVAEFRRDKTL